MINSDHRSTFTPYLLSKMLYLSGFETEDIYYVDPIYKIHHKIINRIFKKKLISLNQGLSHGLIAVAKF